MSDQVSMVSRPSIALLKMAERYQCLSEESGGHGITAVLMAALSIEAFFNDVAFGIRVLSVENTSRVGGLGAILETIEKGHGSISLKYQISYQVLSGQVLDTGAEPFQSFKLLIDLRNAFVHSQPEFGALFKDEVEESEAESKWRLDRKRGSAKLVSALISRGLIPRDSGESAVDWRRFLTRREVVDWAIKTVILVREDVIAGIDEESVRDFLTIRSADMGERFF